MVDFNILRARKDVRYTSSVNPTFSDGTIIGEIWQVTVAPYEKFCLIDRVAGESAWIGTRGTSIFPVTSAQNPDLLFYYDGTIEGSSVIDASPNNNHGTVVGNPLSTATGPNGTGNSLTFLNGGNRTAVTRLSLPSVTNTGSTYTISAWFNCTDASGTNSYGTLFADDTNALQKIVSHSCYNAPTTQLYIFGGSIGVPSYTTNEWHHLLVVYNGSVLVYWDGNFAGGFAGSSTVTLANMGSMSAAFNDRAHTGHIWRPRFFDRNLTTDEISTLYNEGV